MKLTNLEPASDFQVEEWLIQALELTDNQKRKMREYDIVRSSRFYFYKPRKKSNVSFWWRLTIFFIPIYYLILTCFMPIKYLFTGELLYNQKFYDNFHAKWITKLGW